MMDEPPEYDFYEQNEEDELEQMYRDELLHLADDEMAMEMEPDDFEEEQKSSENSPHEKKSTESLLYTSPHQLYKSPEVFKELNNDISKNRNVNGTTLAFDTINAGSDDLIPPKVQQNVAVRGPQIQNLLASCLFTTQQPQVLVLSNIVSEYLDDRPITANNEDYATITLASGTRRYLRKRRVQSSADSHVVEEGMLSRPMKEILKEAEAEKIKKLATKHTKASEMHMSQSHSMDTSTNSSSNKDVLPALSQDKELWVDKYSPKSFTQLLSSEKINREVLRCIKLWDKFVFDRSTRDVEKRHYDVKGNIVEKNDFGQRGGGRGQTKSDDVNVDDDAEYQVSSRTPIDKRPEMKLILLAGPPGTGKTTLAHIVAQHCGYRTIEVNASDDRTVDSLRDIIARSTSNNTLDEHFVKENNSHSSHTSSKPNCIILDEIDGMDGRQPIDALIAIAKTPLNANKKNPKRNSKNGNIVLTRPIICICNDQFSPILRDLRKYAQVFVFSPSTDARLVARLKQICSQEGILNIASSSLSSLSQASGGDIRSAINTLQFAAMRAQAQVEASRGAHSSSNSSIFLKTIGSMITTGLKDERQDVFQLWGQIFSLKAAAARFSKKFKLLAGGKVKNDSQYCNEASNIDEKYSKSHAMRVLDTILGYNDHQLVLNGVHENYLGIKYTDPNLIKTCSAADWLSVGNILEGNLGSGDVGLFSTSKYVPGVIAVVHLLCASDTTSPQQQRLQYPKKLMNCRYNRQQRENILQQFYEGACIHARCATSRMVSGLEFVPSLLDILALGGPGSGGVRPGPMQMQSDVEKMRIARVTEIMMACGLSYERQTIVDTKREKNCPYQLEPDIEVFTLYDKGGEEYAERRKCFATSSEVKHLLHLEVRARLQKAVYAKEMEQQGKIVSNFDSTQQQEMEQDAQDDIGTDDIVNTGVKRTIDDMKRSDEVIEANEKKSKVPDRKRFSFFSSGATKPINGKSSSQLGATVNKKAIRFKFCSGFSNAVKRPVSIREFM